MLQVKIFQVNPLGTNCIVLWEDTGHTCAIVDPGFYRPDEEEMVFGFISKGGLTPDAVLLTHAHFDHTWGVATVRERYGSTLLERLGLEKTVRLFDYNDIADGRIISAGGVSWQVISTPGHSQGSTCYWCKEANVLLSGDTLFAGSIGRTDLDGGDYDALMRSIFRKLLTLPGDTDVLPGHGRPTTLAQEAATNPFLLPFNEPDID